MFVVFVSLYDALQPYVPGVSSARAKQLELNQITIVVVIRNVVELFWLHYNRDLFHLFQVVQLMGTDLLRHQQKWKDGLLEIRQIMANLVNQVRFPRNH